MYQIINCNKASLIRPVCVRDCNLAYIPLCGFDLCCASLEHGNKHIHVGLLKYLFFIANGRFLTVMW